MILRFCKVEMKGLALLFLAAIASSLQLYHSIWKPSFCFSEVRTLFAPVAATSGAMWFLEPR